MADKVEIQLRLECGHHIVVDKRPNPRKVWPDPQLCTEDNKKKRVVEIHYATPIVSRTTSPHAPKPKRKRKKK